MSNSSHPLILLRYRRNFARSDKFELFAVGAKLEFRRDRRRPNSIIFSLPAQYTAGDESEEAKLWFRAPAVNAAEEGNVTYVGKNKYSTQTIKQVSHTWSKQTKKNTAYYIN